MKKLKIIITIIALAAICGSAVVYFNSKASTNKDDGITIISNNEETSTENKKDSEKSTSNTTENKSKDTTNTNTKDTTNNEEAWYCGKWENAKRIQTGNVAADDGEGIDNIIKNPIEFKSSTSTYNNEKYTNVKYSVENISKDEFSQEYGNKVTFEMLGISANNVEYINVESYDSIDTKDNEITDLYGTTLYKKDNNKMIICKGGNFFELTKIN